MVFKVKTFLERQGIPFFAWYGIAGFGLRINPSPHEIRIARPGAGVKKSKSGGPGLRRADGWIANQSRSESGKAAMTRIART